MGIRLNKNIFQGSGWGWLGYNRTGGKLEIATCANQDPLEATTGLIPLFGKLKVLLHFGV